MLGLTAKIEYPKLEITKYNLYDANLIFPSYSGKAGEFTALNTYAYQHYVLGTSEISTTLIDIGIAEMGHHELLGKALKLLGANPMIGDGRYFWNGSFINYQTDLKSMIKADIEGEKNAIREYENCVKHLKTQALKSLIERILIDEELHLDTLEKIFASL